VHRLLGDVDPFALCALKMLRREPRIFDYLPKKALRHLGIAVFLV
jgi:hypothetical protein